MDNESISILRAVVDNKAGVPLSQISDGDAAKEGRVRQLAAQGLLQIGGKSEGEGDVVRATYDGELFFAFRKDLARKR